MDSQRALLELQRHHSAIDRLTARRGSLPEDARLAELAGGLAVVDQLAAERQGNLTTLQREQARLEDEIDMVTRKAHSEEDRAASGRVTSPKELTAIQEEVAALKRRQTALEDDLLERMEQRETLEGELAELDSRRETITAEQVEVTRARDAPWSRSTPTSPPSGPPPTRSRPGSTGSYGPSTTRSASASAGSARPPWSATPARAAGVLISPVELAALRKLPPETVKRCENCRRILVVE